MNQLNKTRNINTLYMKISYSLTVCVFKNTYVFCQPEHRQDLIYPRNPGDSYRQIISLFKAEDPAALRRVTLSEAIAYTQ